MPNVYISYRRKTSALLAQLIVRNLKQRQIGAYLDTDRNDTAGVFPDRLLQAINDADVFVCLVGEGTFESDWVQREIEHANGLGKPMIPIFQESNTPIPLSAAPTPFIKALLERDGVQVFDEKNVYIDTAIEMLAKMVENTTAWRIQPNQPQSTPAPQPVTLNINNLTGQTVAQYAVGNILGQGGMGAVYRAHQTGLNRDVAFKVLAPSLAQQPEFIERFSREAQTAARLEHPNIVPIYDYGMYGSLSYIVMRLLTGGSLAERLSYRMKLDKGLPSLSEVSAVLRGLAGALDYAHSRGVIHCDIKANNVMFDEQGTPFLVDFGIAKITTASTGLIGTGITMGTSSYMSPEQWKGESITPATDQYSLGVMTYHILTGRLPFEATTPYGLMNKHLNQLPTAPDVWRADLPPTVKDVLAQAMAKAPKERFPSIRDFVVAFDKAIEVSSSRSTGFFTTSLPNQPSLSTRPLTSTKKQPLTSVPPRVIPVTKPLTPDSKAAVAKKVIPSTDSQPQKPIITFPIQKTVAPMSIFVSYAKKNVVQQQKLVQFLESKGHQVWFDRELSSKGGQKWWNVILDAIRSSELFIFVLAQESLKSRACRKEYEYANVLRKRILPVAIEMINHDRLPDELNEIQTVPFWQDNGKMLLINSLVGLPPFVELPAILPIPPEAPIHRINEISEQIISSEPMTISVQMQLVQEMEIMLDNNEKWETVLEVLEDLKNRDDFAAKLSPKVGKLLKSKRWSFGFLK